MSFLVAFGLTSVLLCVTGAAQGGGSSLTGATVPLWARFETSLTNVHNYTNPFTDVALRSTFTRPDKSQVTFWGFHDGDGNGGQSGNGGIALRAPLWGDPAYSGLELQITDERFERSYFPNATAEQLTGALYFVSGAKELAYIPGEWNHYRIEMRGPKVKVWLNQKLVQDVDLDTLTKPAKKHGEGQELLDAPPGAKRPRRGHIGFQDLSESGEWLLFRNVQITELD
jgi:hypothetical protein